MRFLYWLSKRFGGKPDLWTPRDIRNGFVTISTLPLD